MNYDLLNSDLSTVLAEGSLPAFHPSSGHIAPEIVTSFLRQQDRRTTSSRRGG